ncbi:hypothetical protein SARC_14858 [Sphaeroforma arctica JP610]|uniref:Uncharacterized protein n=1 Tax=Sphaeroforma arctica JP610 TaxID=667725 RepID=A0A0L0F7G3_9EUKA|nr:hypothetical protein SARC_14858 [Sphaeroforma arctica JP610]KNC72584.1 hypothetical protein SARC_14858 [Sphaeroforma arctica JP610]|eukprot:XP_014146486.1 hypothetical protein SARC_14858 [Sphaeroforma arctica JP610]
MDMEETTEEGWSVAPPNTNTNTKTGSTAATHGHYGNMTMTFNTPSTHTNAFANSQNAGAHTQAFGRGALHFSDSDMKMGDSTDIGRAEPSFGAAHTAATRDKRGNMTMAFNNSSKTNTNNNITHNKIASTNSNLRTSAPVSQPQPQTQLVGLAIPNNSNSLHTNVNTVGAWEASSFDNGSTAATRDRRGNMTMTFNNKPTTIQGAQASRDTDRAHTATAAAFNTDGSDPTDGYTSAHAREVRDSTEDGRQQPTFGKAGTAATRDRRGNMTMTFNNNPAPTSTVTGEPAGDTGGAMADPENVPRAFHTDTSTAGKGGPRAFTQDTGNVGEEKRKASADSNHSNTAFGGQALGASLRSRLGPAPAPAPAPQGLGVGTDVSAEGESKKAGTSTMEKLIQMNDGKRLDADDLRSQRFNASDQTVTEWKKVR